MISTLRQAFFLGLGTLLAGCAATGSAVTGSAVMGPAAMGPAAMDPAAARSAAPGSAARAPSLVPQQAPDEASYGTAVYDGPRAGDRTLELRAFSGVPIVGRSFFWNSDGDDDQAGIKARYFWHLTDRFAIGAGATASAWFLSGPDAFAGEVEAVGKWYVYRSPELRGFVDITGGYMQSTRPVPEGGTEWNFSFSFGAGTEVPLTEQWDLLIGLTYHHISNALGREAARNPSQNEAQFGLGMVHRF